MCAVQVTHHRPELDNGRLDFGAMVTGERRATQLTIHNDNPVDVSMPVVDVAGAVSLCVKCTVVRPAGNV